MEKKINIQIDMNLASRWLSLKNRFSYKTNVGLIEDLIYFFETNPVNPKQQFGGLLKDIENKIDEFHKDNNRVISVVRNIEKNKFDVLIKLVAGSMKTDLGIISKEVLRNKFDREVQEIKKNETLIKEKEYNKIKEELKESEKSKNTYKKEAIKVSEKKGEYHNKLNKIASLYSVEKSTFGKNKIVFEMSEDEFKKLIKL